MKEALDLFSEEETFEEGISLSGQDFLGRSIVNETDDPEIGFLFRYMGFTKYISKVFPFTNI
jgi:hypothetical protein